MKYFTYELIATANGWVTQTPKEQQQASDRFWKTVEDYYLQLDTLKSRVSKPAWNLFRHGFARYGLHDARLLSLRIGDGLDYEVDGRRPFRLNYQPTSAQIEFLNHFQDFHCIFQLRGVRRAMADLYYEEGGPRSLGDLFIYELTAADDDHLQLGFLFASGASIIADFRKLVFRRQRIKRQYDLDDIYS